jgi:hypothetical protein
MKRRLAPGSVLLSLSVLLAVACSGNDSSGGPPQSPCTDNSKTPLLCGSACLNKCGCNECSPGETRQIDGTWYACSGKCLAPQGSGTGGTGGGGATGGGSGGSGGIDCQTLDCNANPPLCGACNTCACCSCNNGDIKSIGGKSYLCVSGCYQPVTDGG